MSYRRKLWQNDSAAVKRNLEDSIQYNTMILLIFTNTDYRARPLCDVSVVSL